MGHIRHGAFWHFSRRRQAFQGYGLTTAGLVANFHVADDGKQRRIGTSSTTASPASTRSSPPAAAASLSRRRCSRPQELRTTRGRSSVTRPSGIAGCRRSSFPRPMAHRASVYDWKTAPPPPFCSRSTTTTGRSRGQRHRCLRDSLGATSRTVTSWARRSLSDVRALPCGNPVGRDVRRHRRPRWDSCCWGNRRQACCALQSRANHQPEVRLLRAQRTAPKS